MHPSTEYYHHVQEQSECRYMYDAVYVATLIMGTASINRGAGGV